LSHCKHNTTSNKRLSHLLKEHHFFIAVATTYPTASAIHTAAGWLMSTS